LSFKNEICNKIEFEVTDQQKCDTKSVWFIDCPAVDFIDMEILKRFPNLNALTFFDSDIPILKNIFTVELKMIQYLCLVKNQIKILEAHVFDELVELKWIDLANNEIEEILHPIFAKNKKLGNINFHCNQIQTLHPNLFEGLPRLQEVDFDGNPKINKYFNLSNIHTLKEGLKPLFDNYLEKYRSPMSVKELELVS
jgi:Leucine-rich repeat (LRR) protein